MRYRPGRALVEPVGAAEPNAEAAFSSRPPYPTAMPRPAMYSCLLDIQPKFVYQLWVWVTMLVDHAGVSPADVVVHIVRRGDPQHAVEAYLESRGVAFCYVDPFGDGRFANRIAQLESPVLRQREFAVLCDTDLAILAPLAPWIGRRSRSA